MAEKLGDAGTQGNHLAAIAVTHWMYMEPRESVSLGLRGAELLRQAGHLWYLVDALFFTGQSLLFMGRIEEAEQTWRELAPLARRLGHTISPPESAEFTQMRLLRAGDIDAYAAFNQRELERLRSRQGPGGLSLGGQVGEGIVHFWRGRWREALAAFEEVMKGEPPGVFYGIGPAFTMLSSAYLGDRAALAVLRQKGRGVSSDRSGSASLLRPMIRAARNSGLGYRGLLGLMLESRSMQTRGLLPRSGRANTGGSWTVLFCAVEALAVLGENAEAAKLYQMVLEGMKSGNLFRGFDNRLLDTVAGIAAGCGGNWAEAEEHFRTAVRRTEELPHIIEQPEVRRWYAWMLLERDAPGDREKARGFLTEAIEMYRRIGMPRHVEIAEALLREASSV
jgi:tetratricopeptide (TPR) repeat protein